MGEPAYPLLIKEVAAISKEILGNKMNIKTEKKPTGGVKKDTE
jgi:hypothetical protein